MGSVDRNLRAEDKEMSEEYQRNVALLNGNGDGHEDETMSGESMMVAGDHKVETHYHLPQPTVPEPVVPPSEPTPPTPPVTTSPWVGRGLAAVLGSSILGGGMLLNSALNLPVVIPEPPGEKTPPVVDAPKLPGAAGRFQLDR